jgi:S-adenosylmethionine-diacylgycerolhomoserine-N-methlytransferase
MSAYSSDIDSGTSWPVEATRRMNRMYRRQRHIYNATRRYYLLGRDRLIAGLRPEAGASVLEIGCGTGRNLVLAARLHRKARFFGIDVSTEMLTSAISAISRCGLTDRIRVAHGDGTAFNPERLFGIRSFDQVLISYSLSMIPDWHRVLHAAVSHLKPGGRLHIVDFGDQGRLPAIARALLRRWLALFDVTPRDDLEGVLSDIAETTGADLKFERPFRGYAQYAVLTLPPGPAVRCRTVYDCGLARKLLQPSTPANRPSAITNGRRW